MMHEEKPGWKERKDAQEYPDVHDGYGELAQFIERALCSSSSILNGICHEANAHRLVGQLGPIPALLAARG